MFQLIVAVIAILLVVIMVIAGIYFGGDAFTDSKLRALYAQNVNSAAQIDGAIQLYYNDHVRLPAGENAVMLQNLKDAGYLRDIPEGDWTVSAEQLYKPIENREQCVIMNRLAGKFAGKDESKLSETDLCPPCDNADYKTHPGCMMK